VRLPLAKPPFLGARREREMTRVGPTRDGVGAWRAERGPSVAHRARSCALPGRAASAGRRRRRAARANTSANNPTNTPAGIGRPGPSPGTAQSQPPSRSPLLGPPAAPPPPPAPSAPPAVPVPLACCVDAPVLEVAPLLGPVVAPPPAPAVPPPAPPPPVPGSSIHVVRWVARVAAQFVGLAQLGSLRGGGLLPPPISPGSG